MLAAGVDFVCVATPDDRHFDAARTILEAGCHCADRKTVRADGSTSSTNCRRSPAESRCWRRSFITSCSIPITRSSARLSPTAVCRHVNNGYCSLLEPKQISGAQFAEWIRGRNPGTYVAVHYIKLIDFTFPGRLKTVTATGQRGLVGPQDGPTWDSCQLRLVYEYESGREAAFDIHTSWVTPDNFPGYVEQEVQFRFDNGVWNGHSRKRGVECTVEGKTPLSLKTTMNNHYNGSFLEPWGQRSQRGLRDRSDRAVRPRAGVRRVRRRRQADRPVRLEEIGRLNYNDLSCRPPDRGRRSGARSDPRAAGGRRTGLRRACQRLSGRPGAVSTGLRRAHRPISRQSLVN